MFNSHFFRLGFVLFVSSLAVGCEQKSVAEKDDVPDNTNPVAQSDGEADDEKNYLEQATDLFQKAKDAGQTTASNASEWVSDQVSGAMEATGNAAQDTGDWVSDTYESLKGQGLTSANSATEWLQDDLKNINAIEYKILPKASGNLQETLNELGAQRWDCFAVDDNSFYLKRKSKSYLRHVPVKDLLKLLPTGAGEE